MVCSPIRYIGHGVWSFVVIKQMVAKRLVSDMVAKHAVQNYRSQSNHVEQ